MYELIISKINIFYYVLSCLIITVVLMLVSMIEQEKLIEENKQLIKEKTSLDKKLKSRFSKTI